jgi:menaquinone-dependent protoporphyrinogen oxidase
MRVAVIYGSRLGATRGIAERIATRLGASGLDTQIAAAERLGDLPEADAYVIGSGVYGRHWMKQAAELAKRGAATLSARPVWLFSVGPVGEWARSGAQLEPREIAGLRRAIRPVDHRVFAGAFDRGTIDGSDLSIVERLVSRRFLPEGDFRDWAAIDTWTDGIVRRLSRV